MKFKFLLNIVFLNFAFFASFLNGFNQDLAKSWPVKAIIKQPVIDMIVQLPEGENKNFVFENIPASADPKNCLRVHQGLFNEKLNIFEKDGVPEQEGDFVKGYYDDIFYGYDANTQKLLNAFWLYKSCVAFLEQEKLGEIFSALPSGEYALEPTIFLTWPFLSKELQVTLSVGTRLKRICEKDRFGVDGKVIEYAVLIPDYENYKIIIDYVPVEFARQEIKYQDKNEARKVFVEIVNELVDRIEKSGQELQYVLGGSSFVKLQEPQKYYQRKEGSGIWEIEGNEGKMYCGYDCSEFVMRMAKMAGIKFPYKNTGMMEKNLKKFDEESALEDGDLIWVRGHIMIISNIEKNEVIESRGYQSGFGRLQRIKLNELFDGIEKYVQLIGTYLNKKQISILDRQGKVAREYSEFKLLKLVE